MDEEELQELARQPIPPQAEHVPALGSVPEDESRALDDANEDMMAHAPGTALTRDQLARAAVLEQMAHGGAYRGNETGNAAAPEHEGQADLNPMLIENGYEPNPSVIRGANGLEMVVYAPSPGSKAAPVLAFRGSQECADWRHNTDVDQIGDAQYEANRALIDQTMSEISSRYPGQRPDITGHSLGGALAQRTASDHLEETGHITTFQAPGIDEEQAERIEEYNAAHPDRPVTADHFRARGDIVPWAGEQHAPGTVHTTQMGGAGGNYNPLAHTEYLATPYALQTEEGRAALPHLDPVRDAAQFNAIGGLESESVEDHDFRYDPRRMLAEGNRRIVGGGIRVLERNGVLDAAHVTGDMALDVADRAIASTESAQDGVDILSDAGNAAVDDVQQRAASVADAGHANVDGVQRGVNMAEQDVQCNTEAVQVGVNVGMRELVGDRATQVALAPANLAVDTAQNLAHDGVATVNTAVDLGQQAARGANEREQGMGMDHRVIDLSAWSRRRIDDAVMLVSPERDVHACIAPRVRPVRSLDTWLSQLASTTPDLRDIRSASDIEELVTDAGEYAQRVSIVTATRRWALGMILGEHEVVTIHASSNTTDPAPVVDELLRLHVTPWASDRVRMYRYTAPAGWFGTRETWATVWHSTTRARIVACDAIPQRSASIETRDLLWPAPFQTGSHREIVEGRVCGAITSRIEGSDIAAIADLRAGTFAIRLHLIDGNEIDLDVLRALAASIERLPERRTTQAATLDWMVA